MGVGRWGWTARGQSLPSKGSPAELLIVEIAFFPNLPLYYRRQPLSPDGPDTKCISCKYGNGANVAIAITAADFTPAWVSAVLDTEVKSFDTQICGQGQVGITVLILNIVYSESKPSMPKSIAVKMHGLGEEQRKNSAAMGLYFKEIFVYHDFNVAK